MNRKKVLKNVYWAVLGKVVNILCGLFVGILVARYLGPEQFGLMNYVISYVTLFSILATFGFDNIEIRELSKENSNVNEIMGTAFGLRFFFAIITLVLILITLISFESDTFTAVMVMVYSSSLLLTPFNIIRNYFTSIILNEYVVKTEIARSLIGAGIKLILLWYKAPLEWFIVATTFDFVLVASGYLLSYKRKQGDLSNWKFSKVVSLLLIKESFPLLLSGAAIIIYQKIDQVIIRNLIDNAALGQFAVASRILEIGIFLPMVISQTVSPLLVKAFQNNRDDYIKKRQQFLDLMLWGGFGISITMSLLAKPAINILFGSQYVYSIPVLQLMAWKILFVSMQNSSGQIILIEGIQKYVVIRNITGCIVSVFLNFLLIPFWGIMGSAFATVITLLFSGFFSHFFIKLYRPIFKSQIQSMLFGWKELINPLRKYITK